jgi:restriction system protein
VERFGLQPAQLMAALENERAEEERRKAELAHQAALREAQAAAMRAAAERADRERRAAAARAEQERVARAREELAIRDARAREIATYDNMSALQFEHALAYLCARDGCTDVEVVGARGITLPMSLL